MDNLGAGAAVPRAVPGENARGTDRKSTRLNSSHRTISYAVFSYLHSFPTRRSSDLVQTGIRRNAPGASCQSLTHRYKTGYFLYWNGFRFWRSRPGLWNGQPRRGRGRSASRARGKCSRNRSEEHTSELQSPYDLVCRLLLPTLFPYTTLFRSRTDWHSPERPWCVLPVANSQIQNRLFSLLERVQVLEIATRSVEWTTSARARPFREPCQGKMLAEQIGRAHV